MGRLRNSFLKKVIPSIYITLYSFKAFMLFIFHMNLRIILEVNNTVTFPTV